MSTWKKYGGTNKLDKINNITVNTVVANQLTLKNIYVGDWDICGGLRTRDNAIIGGNLLVNQDITGNGNLTIYGAMNVFDTNIIGNLLVENNLLVNESIYLDASLSTIFSGVDSKFGFNKLDPQATLDISSNLEQTLYMYSSATNNKNVVAQNGANQGITVNVEPSRAYIDFYVDNSMNLTTENASGRLLYEPGGNFTVDVSNIMKIKPRVVFSKDLSKTLINDERIVVYSDTGVPYLPTVYSSLNTSMAANFVAHDNSSNTYLKIGTEQGKSVILSGGAGPSGQIMGTYGLTDPSLQIYPTFNVFSGILTQNLTTSMGINKYNVMTTNVGANKYVMDVNGPVHVGHQELLLVKDASFQIYASANVGNTVYAVGGPSTSVAPYEQYFLKSTDGGYTWTTNRLQGASGTNPNSVENSEHIFKAICAISSSVIIIGGDNRYIFRTVNGGTTWTLIDATGSNDTINTGALYASPDNTLIIGLASDSVSPGSIIRTSINSNTYFPNYIITGLSSINAIAGSSSYYPTYVILAGNGGLRTFDYQTGFFSSNIAASGNIIYDVKTTGSAAIAVGVGAIYYSLDYITNLWTRVDISGTLRKIVMLDFGALAIGDNNLVYYTIYTTTGLNNWRLANLNGMGNASMLSGLNLSTLVSTNANSFIITSGKKTFHLYSPYLLNRPNNNVIEASGNMVLSGDIQINDAGQLLSNNTTFNILPTNATSINIGNTVIGGNTFIKTNLDVFRNIYGYQKLLLTDDASLNSKLFVEGDASFNSTFRLGGDALLNSKLFVKGDASFNSTFRLGGDASLNSKLFVQGDASFNSTFRLGGDASLNSKLFVQRDASFNSNVLVGGDASLNSKLFVKGDASFNSNVLVGGDASLNSKLFVKGDALFNSNVLVGGDVSLNNKLFVNKDASFNSNLLVGGDVSFNSRLFVTNDVSFNQLLRVGGNTILNKTLQLLGDASLNSNVFIGGDASLNSRLFVNNDVSFNQLLRVAGDVTFNKTFCLVGDASLNGNAFLSGDASFNKTLRLGGDASLNSKLFVQGDTSLNSTLRVGGDVSFNSKLYVNGDASLNSRLFVGNDVSLNRRLYVGSNATMLDISARNLDLSGGLLRVNTIDTQSGSSLFVGNTNATNTYIQPSTKLFLGNPTGQVEIFGNLILPTSVISTNINNLEIKNKTILLNDEAVGTNVSAYSGWYIRDNNVNNASYILSNGTMDGYIFKSATSANRVNLDVSGLRITAGTQQFVLLKPAAVASVSADYTITTGIIGTSDISGLDASLNRRVERDIVNTTATTQVLSTGLLATGLYANKTVAQIISNTQFDVSGNCIATRIGLGTNTVNTNYALDIVGNARTTANIDVSGSVTVQTNANIYGYINSYGTIVQW